MPSLSSHDIERKGWSSSALVPLVLLVLLVAAYPWAYRFLPPRHQVEPHWGDGGANWFGHGSAACWGFAAAILALLFTLKYWITRQSSSPGAAFAWYVLLLASVLPGVWLLVSCEWDNESSVSPACIWVGDPVALLAVPTAFLLYDVAKGGRLPARWYAARCLLEALLILPFGIAWVYFQLFVGWIGF